MAHTLKDSFLKTTNYEYYESERKAREHFGVSRAFFFAYLQIFRLYITLFRIQK